MNTFETVNKIMSKTSQQAYTSGTRWIGSLLPFIALGASRPLVASQLCVALRRRRRRPPFKRMRALTLFGGSEDLLYMFCYYIKV